MHRIVIFKGGSPEENLAITLNILNGNDRSSRRDVVVLNAGLSLYVAESGYHRRRHRTRKHFD